MLDIYKSKLLSVYVKKGAMNYKTNLQFQYQYYRVVGVLES